MIFSKINKIQSIFKNFLFFFCRKRTKKTFNRIYHIPYVTSLITLINVFWCHLFFKKGDKTKSNFSSKISVGFVIISMVSACTGLAGEPDVVATLPPPTSVADVEEAEPLFPQSPPDIANGALIFAENCTDCHGENGDGLGQLVLDGSVTQPPDMTDITQTSLETPLQWYDIITNGRIENLMPPWKNALTAQERWDVALYAYTLAYDEDMLALGEQVWLDKCADCDAINGLTNLETSVRTSDITFGNTIDRDNFGNTLAQNEIRGAVAYARSLSVENSDSIGQIPEVIPAREAEDTTIGTFKGIVEHGTVGGEVPPDTVIQMQYGNQRDGFEFAQTTINADNTFTFEDIPLTTAYTYNVGAIYRDKLYTTTLFEGHPDDIEYDQTIVIYDLTNDPFVINISNIDLFINPIEIPDFGTGLRVTQVIRYNNSSDRMYISGRAIGDGREATLLIQFPVGALITSGEANGRYIVIEDIENVPDSVIDTYPIPPGNQHEVVVEYFVPYTDGAILDQPFNNAIDAEITITIPNNLEIVGDTFTQTEQNDAENLRVYSASLTIESDPKLIFEVAGDPFAIATQGETAVPADTLFPVLLVVVGVTVVAVIAMIIISNRGNSEAKSVDKLIQQIAELDEMHENGQFNHDVYQRQRSDLKEQLTQLMQKTDVSTKDS